MSIWNGYVLLLEMHTRSPEPIFKSLPNGKREVIAKPVAVLSSNSVSGFGESIHPLLVKSCNKLLPYQADFGEELQSWLQDEELGGHKVAGMQTDLSPRAFHQHSHCWWQPSRSRGLRKRQ